MENFKTKDTYLASTLRCLGYHLDTIEKDGKNYVFVFDPSVFPVEGNIEEDVAAYWNHGLRVDPLTLFTAFKELKNRMYNTL